jgi:Protein of unknown function (DUF3106)
LSRERRTRRWGKALAAALALLLGVWLMAAVGWAQGRPGGGGGGGGGPQGQGRGMGGQGRGMQGQGRGMQGLGAGEGFMRRLRALSPEEQERVLANDKHFQSLPPERQARIRENLRRWNALSPQEKKVMLERQRVFASMTPEQRQQARELFQEWRELPTARHHALMQAFREMRDMAPAERQKYLGGQEIKSRFSPQEIRLLDGLGGLLPSARPPGSSDSERLPQN